MKSLDIFCASPASTAICSSMDQYTMVRHSMKTHINRHTQRLGDRLKDPALIPCSSQLLPFEPKPYNNNNYQKPRKSSSSSKEKEIRRKSSADISDQLSNSSRYLLSDHRHNNNNNNKKPTMLALDFISSSESALVPYENRVRESNNTKEIAVFRSSSTRSCGDNYPVFKTSSSLTRMSDSHARKSFSSNRVRPSDHQVVELRVSIHCKGCEGKVRKHLSRMEGVTSFSIDFPLKKVTVIGDVTPLGVLESISKVKNAAFWPSPTTTTSSSSSSSSTSSSIYVGRA